MMARALLTRISMWPKCADGLVHQRLELLAVAQVAGDGQAPHPESPATSSRRSRCRAIPYHLIGVLVLVAFSSTSTQRQVHPEASEFHRDRPTHAFHAAGAGNQRDLPFRPGVLSLLSIGLVSLSAGLVFSNGTNGSTLRLRRRNAIVLLPGIMDEPGDAVVFGGIARLEDRPSRGSRKFFEFLHAVDVGAHRDVGDAFGDALQHGPEPGARHQGLAAREAALNSLGWRIRMALQPSPSTTVTWSTP